MPIRYDARGPLLVITLDRPEVLNAMDRTMTNELHEAWLAFRDDIDLRVAIVTGAGRAFCGGLDMRTYRQPAPAGEKQPEGPGRHLWETRQDVGLTGIELWKPTIAAINGHC